MKGPSGCCSMRRSLVSPASCHTLYAKFAIAYPGRFRGRCQRGAWNIRSGWTTSRPSGKKSGIVVDAQASEGESLPSGTRASTEDVVLPRKLARKIVELVADHDAARERPRDAAIKLFEGVAPRNQRFRDALRPVVLQWMEVCDWFMARTHESGTKDDDIDLAELRKNFELFESTLLAITGLTIASYSGMETRRNIRLRWDGCSHRVRHKGCRAYPRARR